MTQVGGPTGFQYIGNNYTSTVSGASGTDTVSGDSPKPVVVDGAPPRRPPGRGAVRPDGMPEPKVGRAQARAEYARISRELDAFDFSQPASESSVAQMIQLRDQLMALMLKLRTSELSNRDKELQTMVAKRLAGIEKGLDAARKELIAGLISGAVQIGAGAVSMVGGAKAMKGAAKTELTAGVDAAAQQGANNQALMQVYSGGSQMIQGFGSIVTAPINFEAKKDEAEKARLELEADTASQRMNQASERAQKNLDDFRGIVSGVQSQTSETGGANNRVFS